MRRIGLGALLALVCFIPMFSTDGHAVPVQWTDGNGHFYEAFTSPVTLRDAIATSESMIISGFPGHLVTIASAEEEAFLVAQFG